MTDDAAPSIPDPSVTVVVPQQQQQQQQDDPKSNDSNNEPQDNDKSSSSLLSLLRDSTYDVILCGTGLVQSILASALARAGCRVLHVDGNDHYGELDTSWNLSYLLSRREDGVAPPLQQQPPLESVGGGGGFGHREYRTDTLEGEEEEENDYNDDEKDGPTTTTTKTQKQQLLRLHREGMQHSLRFHAIQRTTTFPVTLHSFVQTAYGRGVVQLLEPRHDGYHRLVIQLLSQRRSAVTTAASLPPKLYVGIPNSKICTSNNSDNNANSNNTTTTITVDDAYLYQHHQIRTVPAELAAHVLDAPALARQWALDVTPALLYCVGPAVSGLLTSGVADTCEFKSLEGILYLQQQQSQSPTELVFNRVPCSKNDVFASPLLTPMDKRRLMKFLQTALDYATAEHLASQANDIAQVAATNESSSSSSLQSWNERHLLQGRSLSRPQNKAVATNDLQHLQELCHNSNNSRVSFEQYLVQDQTLSPRLTALVRHALALETTTTATTNNDSDHRTNATTTTTTTVADGMKRLCAHLLALGRFGTTAFLVPLYGSGELSQAFCRSAAVYGATYLLRRAPTAIVLSSKLTDQHSSQPPEDPCDASPNTSTTTTTRAVQGIVLHGPPDWEPAVQEMTTRGEKSSSSNTNLDIGRTQTIPCRHVVVPQGALRRRQTPTPRPLSRERVLRRISLLSGKPYMTDDDNNANDDGLSQRRHLLIIPPYALGPEQSSTIHGLLLDEGVHVAPHVVPPDGCSVLHWTMTIRAPPENEDNNDNTSSNANNDNYYATSERLLEKALQVVLQQHQRRRQAGPAGGGQPSVPVQEIFHVTFSYNVDDDDDDDDDTLDTTAPPPTTGLHVIHRPRPGVVVDDAFDVAASIFAQICPEEEFLKMSSAVDEKVKEALGDLADEVDEENLVLKSAVGIMAQTTTTTSPATEEEEEAGVNCPENANNSKASENG